MNLFYLNSVTDQGLISHYKQWFDASVLDLTHIFCYLGLESAATHIQQQLKKKTSSDETHTHT